MGSGIFREKKWTCASCGHQNKGRFNNCQSCGRSRDQGIGFNQAGGPIISDPSLIIQAKADQDWYCDHCGSGNDDLEKDGVPRTQCLNCGQSRDEADVQHFEALSTAQAIRRRGRTLTQASTPGSHNYQKPTRKTSWGWIKWVGGLAIMLALIYFFFIQTFPQAAQIAGFSWERSVSISRQETVQGSGWSLPLGATQTRTESRVHHHNQIETSRTPSTQICDWNDKGNGFEEAVMCPDVVTYRQEPVYRTYYFYTQKEMRHNRTRTSGASDRRPFDPVYQLNALYVESASSVSSVYYVHFLDEAGVSYTKTLSRSEWDELPDTGHYTLHLNRAGQVRSFEPL